MENRKLGVQFFNETWDLIDKQDRTHEEDSLMMDKAHASSLHWRLSSTYTPVNGARSQWQLSRVYALLKMGEPALYHAKDSLALCKGHQIEGLDLAFAYEAMARAYAVLLDAEKANECKALAEEACECISAADDQAYVRGEIATI